ncbi:hypothetical protein [Chondromyces crocatus]|nr:hypothetical protein [Chondromyces crocatus]
MKIGGEAFSSVEGSVDIFVTKARETGGIAWSRHFGDREKQHLSDVAAAPDGGVVFTGVFSGTIDFGGGPLTATVPAIYLVKLDAEGQHVWSRSFHDEETMTWAYAVTVDPAGDVVLYGNLEGSLDFGGLELETGGLFPFLVKFDDQGRPLWGKSFRGSTDQTPLAIATDQTGNIYVTEEAKYATIDGKHLMGDAFSNALTASFAPDGTLRWARIFRERQGATSSGAPDTIPVSMAVDPSGNVALTGVFGGTIDFGSGALTAADPHGYASYVVKLNTHGDALWSVALDTDTVKSVGFDGVGDVLVGGSFAERLLLGDTLHVTDGDADIFAARLNGTNGTPSWSHSLGDGADQRATRIAMDQGGRLVLTGVFDGSLDLGCGALSSGSGNDLFLAGLCP